MNVNKPPFEAKIGSENEEWPHKTLDSKLSKNYASYVVILNDLKFVKQALSLIIEREEAGRELNSSHINIIQSDEKPDSNLVINKSLFTAAVVTYAKCFVKGKGRNANLGSAKIFKEKNAKLLHKKLLEERHKYHAHADESESEYLQPILATNPKNQAEKRLCCINYQKAHELVPKLKEYLILVDEAIKYVKIKEFKASQKCYNEETKN